jgi:DNA-binding NarL/FixJ family response regulator
VPTATWLPEGTPPDEQSANLIPREQEVGFVVVQGLTNRQIAFKLMLSEQTVATHIRNILKKLGLHSRKEIAAWFAQQR